MRPVSLVNFKRLHQAAIVPRYATEGSVGLDLFCHSRVTLDPGEVTFIGIGWALELPEGYEAQIRARSGLSSKRMLILPNGIGTIDTDYRGELVVPLLNLGHLRELMQALDAEAETADSLNSVSLSFLPPPGQMAWQHLHQSHKNAIITLDAGTAIAQLVIAPVAHAAVTISDDLSVTGRGAGGFGSTGCC